MPLNRLLFERAWLLFLLLAVLAFVTIQVWAHRRNTTTARAAWAGLVAMLALPALSMVVKTPRERIQEGCLRLARAVDAGDVAVIEAHLAGEFTASSLDRDDFILRVEDALTKFRVDAVSLRAFAITVDEDRAIAEFNASCQVRTADASLDRLLSRWRLHWRRRDRDWLVTDIEALPMPFSPIRNLNDVLR